MKLHGMKLGGTKVLLYWYEIHTAFFAVSVGMLYTLRFLATTVWLALIYISDFLEIAIQEKER